MNEVDLVLLCFLSIGGIVGIYSGLINQIGSFLAVWGGFTFSGLISPTIADWISRIVRIDPVILYLTSFLFSFLLIAAGIKVLAVFCSQLFQVFVGTLLNRLLGGILGVVISILIAGTTLNLLERFLPNHGWIQEKDKSRFYTTVRGVATQFIPRLSDFLNSASDKITDLVEDCAKQ